MIDHINVVGYQQKVTWKGSVKIFLLLWKWHQQWSFWLCHQKHPLYFGLQGLFATPDWHTWLLNKCLRAMPRVNPSVVPNIWCFRMYSAQQLKRYSRRAWLPASFVPPVGTVTIGLMHFCITCQPSWCIVTALKPSAIIECSSVAQKVEAATRFE